MMPNTQTLINLITPFIREIASGETEIYNEFSLQHELGIFLRRHFPKDKIQFERHVKSFFPANSFAKREIDISVLSSDRKELKLAIELKFPRNGQYPEQMFSFCRDVVFTEELKAAGFSRSGLIIFADDDLFWRGPTEGIYGFFRGGRLLNGAVRKPTGLKDSEVIVRGNYNIAWEPISDNLKFAVVEADPR